MLGREDRRQREGVDVDEPAVEGGLDPLAATYLAAGGDDDPAVHVGDGAGRRAAQLAGDAGRLGVVVPWGRTASANRCGGSIEI